MKLTGITGTGSGKLGSSVFSVNSGEQIVRQYQPNVANPSTNPQVNSRARLKLLSQLSAVFADVIAIPREGMKSPRNLFVADNYQNTVASNGVASADLASIGITRGGIQIPNVLAERVEGESIDVALAESASQIVSRVVYVLFVRNAGGELQLADSAIVETAGDDGVFPYSFGWVSSDVVVYAYGIFDKSAKATARFGNYGVTSGTQVATLVADRKISDSDYIISKTKGVVLAGESEIEITSITCNHVAVNPSGNTQIPYSGSARVEVEAVDVDGKYLSITVDGVRGETRAFTVGSSFVSANNLAGGEVIRVQIGTMQGQSTFIPEDTYGGTIVIAAQASAFSSVTANGAAIAASGNTQIQQAASTVFAVAATGVANKYLRVSVNGAARTPVAFSNGAASVELANLQINDVVTLAIGHMSGSTFVQDVAYGGTATVVTAPAAFLDVVVNGTTIASSGTTEIVAQGPNNVVVDTENAIGKLLGILDDEDAVIATILIVSERTTYTDYSIGGEAINFAIGTGEDESDFVAEVRFGGRVEFVYAPEENIFNVNVNGTDVNRNMTDQSDGSKNVVFTTEGIADNTKVACVSAENKQVGQTVVVASGNRSTVVNDVATINGVQMGASTTYHFYVGTLNGDTLTVEIVYPYTYATGGSPID